MLAEWHCNITIFFININDELHKYMSFTFFFIVSFKHFCKFVVETLIPGIEAFHRSLRKTQLLSYTATLLYNVYIVKLSRLIRC